MAIIRCEDGFHLYDNSKYDKCPYCRPSAKAQAGNYPETRPANHLDIEKRPAPPPTQSAGAKLGGVTQSAYNLGNSDSGSIDPVVGWLVCIEGSNIGRDYRIHAGMNRIGRDPSNEICISGDEKISREKHASIAFDPENQVFYLQHGGGRNLTYVDNKPALEMSVLLPKAKIKIGTSVFLFIPLCGDDFKWSDVLQP